MTNINEKFFINIDPKIGEITDSLNSEGLLVDVTKLEGYIANCSKIKQDSTEAFNSEVKSRGHEVNINSRKELINWFFSVLKLPVIKSGKTGPSLDADTRETLIDYDITVKYYSDVVTSHAKLNTLNNIKAATVDGVLPVYYELNGAASGRFTSHGTKGTKINMNGIPKDIRDIFKPFKSSQIVVSFDYKNMEQVTAANLSGQKDIIEAMVNGEDLHQNLAEALGVTRKVAKTVTHAIGFGMTPFGLARKLRCTEEEAKDLITKYWEHRHEIKEFKEQTIHIAKMFGYVSTISDFRRPTKGITDEAIYATQIQGSAADLFKQAIVNVSNYLNTSAVGKILTIQHDAIVCSLEQENLQETIEKVKTLMETVHPEFRLFIDTSIGCW